MIEAKARAMIPVHFDASNVSAAGRGPGDDIVRASEIYADDAACAASTRSRPPEIGDFARFRHPEKVMELSRRHPV